MKTKLTFISLSIFFCFQMFGQTPRTNLPHWSTPEEIALLKAKNGTVPCATLTENLYSTPISNPRSMAEWEEIQAIILTWAWSNNQELDILKAIAEHAQEEVEVIIVCEDQQVVINQLISAQINITSNITFLEEDFNTIWVRDYAPNTVYTDDVDSLGLVDWVYNRNRCSDDTLAFAIAEHLELPLHVTTQCPKRIVHTGGNYMSDGLGMAFSSKLVLEENGPNSDYTDCPLTENEFDDYMNEFMGIHTYVKMDNLPHDVIHHIDMHMKLLDEKTLLVGQYPDGVADGPQIEANIQYVLSNFTTTAGEQFEVVRITMPPGINGNFPGHVPWWEAGDYRTYTNAVIVNNTILVPTYEQQHDAPALQVWEEAMPGYNVIGIDCDTLIPRLGALHCITKEVGVNKPLWISTNRVTAACDNESIPIVASIKHIEGISTANVYYKSNLSDPYQSVPMEDIASGDNWHAEIPVQPEGKVYYYIEATASNGKTINRPIPAPEGYFTIEVSNCMVNTTDLFSTKLKMEKIFPNPASAITCIPISSDKNIDASIELVDILGRKVATIFSGEIPIGDSKYFLDANNFRSGSYFVQVKTQVGINTQKLVIK